MQAILPRQPKQEYINDRDCVEINDHLPGVRPCVRRGDADGSLSVLLGVSVLQPSAPPEGGGLLCLLFLRRYPLPSCSAGRTCT